MIKDKEYGTVYRAEWQWLESKGIKPSFIKDLDSKTIQYKYTKTRELFEALAEFY